MELRHLAAFVAVAEERNFSRAAARLNMTQSPLSRQVRLLERDLGVVLFERTTRTVELTGAGEALLAPARRVLTESEAARAAVRAHGSGVAGRVSLGFAGATSYDLVPRLTRAVATRLPGVEMSLACPVYSREAMRRVAEGALDLGVVAMPTRVGIAARVVSSEALLVALPEEHRLADQDAVALADLEAEPFVAFPATDGSAVAEATLRACVDAGFTPSIVQEAPDAYNLLTLVGAGVGVALVVDSARRIRTDHVVFRPLRDVLPPMLIALAWRAQRTSPAVRAVLAVAEEVLPTPMPVRSDRSARLDLDGS